MNNQEKFDLLEEIAVVGGWRDHSPSEDLMRSLCRTPLLDGLLAALKDVAGEPSPEPVAKRISYLHPEYDEISFHLELHDGKIYSYGWKYFSKEDFTCGVAALIRKVKAHNFSQH